MPTRLNFDMQAAVYTIYQLLNVLPCNIRCCSPEVGMLPEASAEGNIPTKGEQHACHMAEHLTIDLLYH